MHALTRRSALGAVAAASAVVLIQGATGPGTTSLGTPAVASAAQLARLTPVLRSHYADAVGAVFLAQGERSEGEVRLVRIDGELDDDRIFTLVLQPLGERLPDAIYELRRVGVPTNALLLNSLGAEGRLQAVVNGVSW